jgi:cytochrome c-type biogenesis protein CcmH
MVAGLAARLKDHPDDAEGWLRLVRAYAVLGDKTKARSALAGARRAMKERGDVLAALDAEQKELGL